MSIIVFTILLLLGAIVQDC